MHAPIMIDTGRGEPFGLTPHRPTTPAASRRHFGLGTVASPCRNPAYRKSPAGRKYCEREAEHARQAEARAEAWTAYYRSQGIEPNDRDAIEEFHRGGTGIAP